MNKRKAEQKKQERKEKREAQQSRRIPLKKYTKGGRLASFMALCNILFIVLAIAVSIWKKGHAGIYVGFLMLMVLILAAIGFVIGINSFKEENKFLRYTYVGTITNAVIWIGILGMYLTYV